MTKYQFKHAVVSVDHDTKHVTTVFDDGKEVHAVPNYDDESLERAKSLGYAGEDPVWEMTEEHDLFHTLVAEAEGRRYSAALRPVATGEPAEKDAAHREECLVFLLQRLSAQGKTALLAGISGS